MISLLKTTETIWVESVVDKGTSFFFNLPAETDIYRLETRVGHGALKG
jgi:signal transduction histidine kinase